MGMCSKTLMQIALPSPDPSKSDPDRSESMAYNPMALVPILSNIAGASV